MLFSLFLCSGKQSISIWASNEEGDNMPLQFEKSWRTMLPGKLLFISLTENLSPNDELCLCLSCSFHLLPCSPLCLNPPHSLLTRPGSRFCLLDRTAHNHGLPQARPPSAIMQIIVFPLHGSFWLHSHSPFSLSPHYSQTGLPEIEICSCPLLVKHCKVSQWSDDKVQQS